MTHGDSWLAAVEKRIKGYCVTRGWQCRDAVCLPSFNYAIVIWDHLGNEGELLFAMDCETCLLIDGSGRAYRPLSAAAFDADLIDLQGLERRPRPSKR